MLLLFVLCVWDMVPFIGRLYPYCVVLHTYRICNLFDGNGIIDYLAPMRMVKSYKYNKSSRNLTCTYTKSKKKKTTQNDKKEPSHSTCTNALFLAYQMDFSLHCACGVFIVVVVASFDDSVLIWLLAFFERA